MWSERWERFGWETHYTSLGGRLRDAHIEECVAELGEVTFSKIQRLTSQAFVALPAERKAVSDDVTFATVVLRKLVQRGTRPIVPADMERMLLEQVALPSERPISAEQWLAAATGPLDADCPLDPSIKLDAVYEEALWIKVREDLPSLSRFLVPQAPLEALVGSSASPLSTERWVDFLLTSPWLERPVVIELDGAQHGDMRRVDQARDRALNDANVRVSRHGGSNMLEVGGELERRLAATAAQWSGEPDDQLVQILHGPAVFTRLLAAIVELMSSGHLPAGGSWELSIEDPWGLGAVALPEVLDLISSVGAIWGVDVAPSTVTSAGRGLARDGHTYVPADVVTDGQPVRILLQPFTAAHAQLPDVDLDVPTVVIRNVYLPGDVAWMPTTVLPRRYVTSTSAEIEAPLERVVQLVFGLPGFRGGQLDAVMSILSGRDACVLLPTGAGKSLIYQTSGLLLPGSTLVVDPLTSLIDDQERRLRVEGVDRVVGLHSARSRSSSEREAALDEVASGAALYAFLTPERLQSRSFRDALEQAADAVCINMVVVDEAHCVSEWGHDFRTAYLQVGRNLRLLCRGIDDVPPPLLALTGTASPGVLRDVIRELEDVNRPGSMHVQRPASFDRLNLTYGVLRSEPHEWTALLREALSSHIPEALACETDALVTCAGAGTKSGLIFVPHVNGRYGLESVRREVRTTLPAVPGANGTSSVEIYSGSAPKDWTKGRQAWADRKASVAEAFKANQVPILVSTKAFGMGIDKPNIRWTVHVGFPSSIESFAQEAGRAGRDGLEARCVLLATPPSPETAELLLDINSSRDDRVAQLRKWESIAGRAEQDDLRKQLFFLYGSFTGLETELASVTPLLDDLIIRRPASRVILARFASERDAQAQEKALYRLAMLGLVDDYTVDHGAGSLVIDLADFTSAHIDAQVMGFISRIEPGKTASRRRQISNAPLEIGPRAQHHLKLLLTSLYDVVEPARVRALAEMYRLAVSASTDAEVRQRIVAYLSDGPMAGVLDQLATASQIDPWLATSLLDKVPGEDPVEWTGAASRQLEAYPDHPILLLVRALGEAATVDGSQLVIQTSFAGAFAGLSAYSVDTQGAAHLFAWASEQLRGLRAGVGWKWAGLLYRAWDAAGLPEDALAALEDETMDRAKLGIYNVEELAIVWSRILARAAATSATAITNRIGDIA